MIKMPLIVLNLLKRGSKSFPWGLQKTIPKDAKSLQIKSLQAFFYCIKAPYYASKRKKNERNSVRN
jgi:hypothetical protein